LLSAAGYEFRGDLGDDGGVVFAKGPESSRTHYLHLVPAGSVQWFDYVAFRDGLRENQTLRDEYAALKKELAARFPLDRPSYQKGKERFVEETLAASRSGQRSR
jgi:GrpB-like predicted nucleotidyltransferase (UPF0157 family)